MSTVSDWLNGMSPEKQDYALEEVCRFLIRAGDWGRVTLLLTSLDFIEAKAAAGLVNGLQDDYRRAIDELPEAREERKYEDERRRVLSRYCDELRAYSAACRERPASGAAFEQGDSALSAPSAPPSFLKSRGTLPVQQSGHVQEEANRRRRIQEFSSFVTMHAEGLRRFGSRPGFCVQQALNFGPPSVLSAVDEITRRSLRQPLILCGERDYGATRVDAPLLDVLVHGSVDVRAVAMTPDGRVAVSGGDDCVLRVWDLATRECADECHGQPDRIFSLAISADGRVAVAGSWDGSLCVWDLASFRLLKTIDAHVGALFAVSMTPDGGMAVSGGEDGSVAVWDVCSGELVRRLSRQKLQQCNSLSLSADGKLALSGHAVSPDDLPGTIGTVHNVWNIVDGELTDGPFPGGLGVDAVALSPDGKTAAWVDPRGVVDFWKPGDDGSQHLPVGSEAEHTHTKAVLAISADGSVAVLSKGAGVEVWDVASRHRIGCVTQDEGSNWSVALSADGRLAVTGGSDGRLRVWDTPSIGNMQDGERGPTTDSIIFLRGRDLAVARDSAGLAVWDPSEGRRLRQVPASLTSFEYLSAVQDGSCVAALESDCALGVWAVETGGRVSRLGGAFPDHVTSFQLMSTGRHAVLGKMDGGIELWDIRQALRLRRVDRHRGEARAIRLAPDDRFVVSEGADQTCRLLDLETGSSRWTLHLSKLWPSVVLAPDGRLMLLPSTGVRLWNIATKLPYPTIACGEGECERTLMCPDGRRFVSYHRERDVGQFHLWDVRTRRCLRTWDCHHSLSKRQVLSPDGRFLITTSAERAICMWDVASGDCVAAYFNPGAVTALSEMEATGRFAIGTVPGSIAFLGLENMALGAPVVTAVRMWRFAHDAGRGRWDAHLTVICPWCGRASPLSGAVRDTLAGILRNAQLSRDSSPCMELPADAWDESGLSAYCLECEQPVRFNPFAVDNSALEPYTRQCPATDGSRRGTAGREGGGEISSCANCDKTCLEPSLLLGSGQRICHSCLADQLEFGKWRQQADEEDETTCSVCFRDMQGAALQTAGGIICRTCGLSAAEMLADAEALEQWTTEMIRDALCLGDGVLQRLTVLRRLDELLARLTEQLPPAVSEGVVQNLGFVGSHPFAQYVRQLALQACHLLGEDIVPFLFRLCRRQPWQLYANVLCALSDLALDDERSQKLFRRAAADPCSEVRSRIPSFLSRYEAGWTREVLEELTTDSEEEIREAAADVIDDWDIADHKMEESEKGLRRLAERVAGEAEPGVRLSLVTALRGTRASWAIRLARKLSDDPDPEVSESMRQVVAEWDARTE